MPRRQLMQRSGHLPRKGVELIHEIRSGGVLVRKDLLPAHEQTGVRGDTA